MCDTMTAKGILKMQLLFVLLHLTCIISIYYKQPQTQSQLLSNETGRISVVSFETINDGFTTLPTGNVTYAAEQSQNNLIEGLTTPCNVLTGSVLLPEPCGQPPP